MPEKNLTLEKYLPYMFEGKFIEAGQELDRVAQTASKLGYKELDRTSLASYASKALASYIFIRNHRSMERATHFSKRQLGTLLGRLGEVLDEAVEEMGEQQAKKDLKMLRRIMGKIESGEK